MHGNPRQIGIGTLEVSCYLVSSSLLSVVHSQPHLVFAVLEIKSKPLLTSAHDAIVLPGVVLCSSLH
jgi:hypothetical protein